VYWLRGRIGVGGDAREQGSDVGEAGGRVGTGVEDASDGVGTIKLAVVRGLLNGGCRNDAGVFRAGVDERMLREDVDYTGNPSRVSVDGAHCIGLKNRLTVGACYAEAFADVAICLLESQRRSRATNGDALAKLAKFMALKLVLQLRLTGQNDLQKLFAGCLEIQEKADFLEGSGIQTLRFVHNQDWSLAGTVALKQPAIQGH